jgi:hypothetical protein
MGPIRCDESYRLEETAGGCGFSVELVVWNTLPLVGGLLDRLYVGPSMRRAVEAALASLKRHCERDG